MNETTWIIYEGFLKFDEVEKKYLSGIIRLKEIKKGRKGYVKITLSE